MNPDIKKFDEVVAGLTAPGQPFELNTVDLNGVEYRNFAGLRR